MIHLSQHQLYDYAAGTVLSCSVLSSLLPPYEVFAFSPTFQKIYRILLVFISTVGALNLRGMIMKAYPQYQQAQGGQNGKSNKA